MTVRLRAVAIGVLAAFGGVHACPGDSAPRAAGKLLVLRQAGSVPLDAVAGPLALRSLPDLRPGARHVRNLCALVIHR